MDTETHVDQGAGDGGRAVVEKIDVDALEYSGLCYCRGCVHCIRPNRGPGALARCWGIMAVRLVVQVWPPVGWFPDVENNKYCHLHLVIMRAYTTICCGCQEKSENRVYIIQIDYSV